MQVYVQQELKAKINPLEKLVHSKVKDIGAVGTMVKDFKTELERQDSRWEGICKAILQTNGMIVPDLNAHNVFKAFQKVIASKQRPGKKGEP